MTYLNEADKKKLIDLIEKGKSLPSVYKSKLFAPEDGTFIQATREYRLVYDGKRHFDTLNQKLVDAGIPWRYYFYFLSPDDFTKFFEAVKECPAKLKTWVSSLMQDLGVGT